jgi:hypothetical protein
MMLNPMMKTATKKRISKNDSCISEIIVLMFKSYFYPNLDSCTCYVSYMCAAMYPI